MAETTPAPKPLDNTVTGTSLLNRIIVQDNLVRIPKPPQATDPVPAVGANMLKAYVAALADPEDANVKADAEKKGALYLLQAHIDYIDDQLSKKVNAILHDPKLQALEASWRGLRYLVTRTETGPSLKLRLFPVTYDNLKNDLVNAIDKDQSSLFKKIYEEEYGTYGGNPFSLLIGDFYFGEGRKAEQFDLLRKISGVAAAAHTPLIAAAHWELFGLDSGFRDLGKPRDLSKIFESVELTEWREFRESDDSRYVTLCLPRFLLRLPYGEKFTACEKFAMDENPPDDPDKVKEWQDREALWGNPAYALGARITNAFALYNWCAAIRGTEGGGVVSDLPVHIFNTREGDKAMKCPTEVAITDRREFELDKLGFVTLVHRKNNNSATFFGGASTQKPKKFDLQAANANAALSVRLPYLLAASRFAHYLKVICRDKVGSFQTKESLSLYLNRWISQYVLAMDDAGQELKAQYPLREARIDVADVPGKPGAYKAVCFLRPHFQLEELTTSIRLVAELPPPVAA